MELCQVEPKPFRFLRDLQGETRDFSGRAPMRPKRRKRRNRLRLQTLSLGRRFLIGVVQIHSSGVCLRTVPVICPNQRNPTASTGTHQPQISWKSFLLGIARCRPIPAQFYHSLKFSFYFFRRIQEPIRLGINCAPIMRPPKLRNLIIFRGEANRPALAIFCISIGRAPVVKELPGVKGLHRPGS